MSVDLGADITYGLVALLMSFAAYLFMREIAIWIWRKI